MISKISATDEQSSYHPIAGALGVLSGKHLILKAYHGGALTGRKTLYHGTSEGNIKSILEKGILPTTAENAINTNNLKSVGMFDMYEDSLGKAYTTGSKSIARMYAEQAAHGGIVKILEDNKTIKKAIIGALRRIALMDDRGVVKANVPTWKMSNIVRNPEVSQAAISTVFDGGLGPEYIEGSTHYKRNSLKEISEYIRKNKVKFGKGVGTALIGAAGAGAGMYQIGGALGLLGGDK